MHGVVMSSFGWSMLIASPQDSSLASNIPQGSIMSSSGTHSIIDNRIACSRFYLSSEVASYRQLLVGFFKCRNVSRPKRHYIHTYRVFKKTNYRRETQPRKRSECTVTPIGCLSSELPIAGQCWRRRGRKILKIKINTIFPGHPVGLYACKSLRLEPDFNCWLWNKLVGYQLHGAPD